MKKFTRLDVAIDSFKHKCTVTRSQKPVFTSSSIGPPKIKKCPNCPRYWEPVLQDGYNYVYQWIAIDPRRPQTNQRTGLK